MIEQFGKDVAKTNVAISPETITSLRAGYDSVEIVLQRYGNGVFELDLNTKELKLRENAQLIPNSLKDYQELFDFPDNVKKEDLGQQKYSTSVSAKVVGKDGKFVLVEKGKIDVVSLNSEKKQQIATPERVDIVSANSSISENPIAIGGVDVVSTNPDFSEFTAVEEIETVSENLNVLTNSVYVETVETTPEAQNISESLIETIEEVTKVSNKKAEERESTATQTDEDIIEFKQEEAMIEQFGKDVTNIEQTTAAESSKLLMKLMSLIRQKLQKSQLAVDFENDKPAQLKIEVDGRRILLKDKAPLLPELSQEETQKNNLFLAPEDLKKIVELLDLPQGEKINLPYQNISIKINDQEIFKVENNKVIFNALVEKAVDKTKAKLDAPISEPVSKPLNRQEQLSKMKADLNSLELIDSLEKIVEERGDNREGQKILEHGNYFFMKGDSSFTIYDRTQKKNLFEREIKIARSDLKGEDLQRLKDFTQQYQQEKESNSPKKEEIEIE